MDNLKDKSIRRIFGQVEIETMLKKIQGKKLKQTERNYLYRSIRPKLIAANILCQDNILQKINERKRDDGYQIEYNLDSYGYSMISLKKKKARKIPIEELIARILIKNPNPRFIEAIPILMIKNRIDKFRLLELASNYNIKNKIGYLLETAFLLRKIAYLEDLLNYLRESKESEETFLAEGDREFLQKTSPERVRRWNLLGRFFDDDFRRLYDRQK